MYKGFILFESLEDPVILNSLEKIYVQVEDNPGDNPRYWNDYKVRISDDQLSDITEKLSRIIKKGWYSHFWNDEEIVVVLPNKVFKIPRKAKKDSKEYSECIDYAIKSGVEEKYLGFWLQEEDIPKVTREF